jgi:hypothetical protein
MLAEGRPAFELARIPGGRQENFCRRSADRGLLAPEMGTAQECTEEENRMATARLRVFPHPDDELHEEGHAPSVPIRLADLYPLLAQAYRDNYVWLRDFEDDQLLVSNDLFEVVRAFSNCRPSA